MVSLCFCVKWWVMCNWWLVRFFWWIVVIVCFGLMVVGIEVGGVVVLDGVVVGVGVLLVMVFNLFMFFLGEVGIGLFLIGVILV